MINKIIETRKQVSEMSIPSMLCSDRSVRNMCRKPVKVIEDKTGRLGDKRI